MDANMCKAIATAGIWIGLGICSFGAPESVSQIGAGAAGATIMIWILG